MHKEEEGGESKFVIWAVARQMGLSKSTFKWPDFRAWGLKGEFVVSSS